ncbi:uncharacterized protein LOC133849771 [Drosophila sulfurigaster albostrigata]|uniref:uncharacterized protein LOC133849771 n=1 Tax=Drosophila sulfurigaster albostrigata TaxID=89887 RepID=UPI002D21DE96|nr:uncharacterized protein LOC133849771 [Drosophila sulfurigaster albostrigata]
MHIAFILIIVLLSCIGAALTSSLIDDLKKVAEDTQVLVNKDEIKTLIAISETIAAHHIAPKEDIEYWQTYSEKLRSWNVTVSRDYSLVEVRNLPIYSLKLLNQYSNGDYAKLRDDFVKLVEQRCAAFKITALKIINAAKKSGIIHVPIKNKLIRLDEIEISEANLSLKITNPEVNFIYPLVHSI